MLFSSKVSSNLGLTHCKHTYEYVVNMSLQDYLPQIVVSQLKALCILASSHFYQIHV